MSVTDRQLYQEQEQEEKRIPSGPPRPDGGTIGKEQFMAELKLDAVRGGVLHMSPLYAPEVYRQIDFIEVSDVLFARLQDDEKWELEDGKIVAISFGETRFEKVAECIMERTFDGTFNYDYTCSACGKTHNAPRANERCPRCGAYVRRVK